MAGRIGFWLFLAAAILLAVDAALGQGMQTFTSEQAAQRHCPADTVVWLNTQARTITFRATLGTVTRSAVLTSAKLRPTKTACAHGQVQNEDFRIFRKV